MKLQEYLKIRRITFADAARELGIKPQYISRYVRLGIIPRPAMMEKIKTWSGNLVTAEDFYDRVSNDNND